MYAKLKGKIKEVYNTQKAFAEAMEMSESAVGQRLSGITQWKPEEMAKACDLLGIPMTEIHLYFFNQKVQIS
ncbi:MAG: DUF739 family protein [Lachnospiraceae bacterium]|nr:DUF739 family protein [Lachnospiraceae bacterium]